MEQEHDIEDFGDENDEDVLDAEAEYLNSWAYQTFKYIKENKLFSEINDGASDQFIIVETLREEGRWGELYDISVVLDKESNRFLSYFQDKIDEEEYDIDGEVYPACAIKFTSNKHDQRLLGDFERKILIENIKKDGAVLYE